MRRFFLSLPILAALAFASCDDGSVTDPVYSDTTETYKALLVADLRGLDMWGSSYSVVLAGFSNDSRYSRIQKNLTSTGTDDVLDSIVLAGIPTTATSIELAVVEVLRQRVATISKCEIPEGHDSEDTLKLELGRVDVSPFGVVNTTVFNGTSLNCIRCHQGGQPAGGLNLSEGSAYDNLVNAPAHKYPEMLRVVPGDAANSYLYKVITEGDENLGYSHTPMFTEYDVATLPELVKTWIELGAKE